MRRAVLAFLDRGAGGARADGSTPRRAGGVEEVQVGGGARERDAGARGEAGLAGEDGEDALAGGGRGVDDGFGAERLDEADLGVDGAGGAGVGEAQVLGADAAVTAVSGWAAWTSPAGRKFIAGAPMKPATKRLAGRLKRASGVSACSIRPARRTTMRSARVIASTWSWVT